MPSLSQNSGDVDASTNGVRELELKRRWEPHSTCDGNQSKEAGVRRQNKGMRERNTSDEETETFVDCVKSELC
jgi:hypothetical protein